MAGKEKFVKCSEYLLKGYSNLSASEKITYLILKSYCWNKQITWVGQQTIALIKRKSLQTTVKTIRALEKAGLIETKRRGQGQTNIYKLIEPKEDGHYLETEKRLNLLKKLNQDQPKDKHQEA